MAPTLFSISDRPLLGSASRQPAVTFRDGRSDTFSFSLYIPRKAQVKSYVYGIESSKKDTHTHIQVKFVPTWFWLIYHLVSFIVHYLLVVAQRAILSDSGIGNHFSLGCPVLVPVRGRTVRYPRIAYCVERRAEQSRVGVGRGDNLGQRATRF